MSVHVRSFQLELCVFGLFGNPGLVLINDCLFGRIDSWNEASLPASSALLAIISLVLAFTTTVFALFTVSFGKPYTQLHIDSSNPIGLLIMR